MLGFRNPTCIKLPAHACATQSCEVGGTHNMVQSALQVHPGTSCQSGHNRPAGAWRVHLDACLATARRCRMQHQRMHDHEFQGSNTAPPPPMWPATHSHPFLCLATPPHLVAPCPNAFACVQSTHMQPIKLMAHACMCCHMQARANFESGCPGRSPRAVH